MLQNKVGRERGEIFYEKIWFIYFIFNNYNDIN